MFIFIFTAENAELLTLSFQFSSLEHCTNGKCSFYACPTFWHLQAFSSEELTNVLLLNVCDRLEYSDVKFGFLAQALFVLFCFNIYNWWVVAFPVIVLFSCFILPCSQDVALQAIMPQLTIFNVYIYCMIPALTPLYI